MFNFKRFSALLIVFAVMAYVGLFSSVKNSFAQTTCSGSFHYPTSCRVSSTGDCVGNTFGSDPCSQSGSQCTGIQRNYICGWSGGVCKVLGNGATQETTCGDTGGGGGGGGTNPNCTTTCTTDSGCMRGDNDCCRTGTQGSQCGVAADGTKKYNCSCRNCTTVCTTLTPTVNNNPKGYLDTASCTASSGWACDPNDYSAPLAIHFYADGLAGAGGTYIGQTTANQTREAAVATACGGYANHGYTFTYPPAYQNGSHTIYAYAINIGAGTVNTLLTNSPKSFSCPTSTPSLVASCQNITAYTTQWTSMTLDQMKVMANGQKLYYCATGAATSGAFDRARFTINGVLQPETTLVRPGSTDYCFLYTLPASVYNYTVVAELHHTSLGWVR